VIALLITQKRKNKGRQKAEVIRAANSTRDEVEDTRLDRNAASDVSLVEVENAAAALAEEEAEANAIGAGEGPTVSYVGRVDEAAGREA
jgi:hypothetical protein